MAVVAIDRSQTTRGRLRRCHNLCFACENEPKAARARRCLFKLRERLGQVDGGVIAPFPSKPKWVRWPRYLRVRREALRRGAIWRLHGVASQRE